MFTIVLGLAFDAASIRKMFKRIDTSARMEWPDTTRATDLVPKRGVSIEGIASLVGAHLRPNNRRNLSPRTAAIDYDGRRDHGSDILS
jgi:hypothetical protein